MEIKRIFEYLLPYQEEGSGYLLVTDCQDEIEINRTCISVQELLEEIQNTLGETWSELPGLFQRDNVRGSDVFRKIVRLAVDYGNSTSSYLTGLDIKYMIRDGLYLCSTCNSRASLESEDYGQFLDHFLRIVDEDMEEFKRRRTFSQRDWPSRCCQEGGGHCERMGGFSHPQDSSDEDYTIYSFGNVR